MAVVGTALASIVVLLTVRYRSSRARVKEWLVELFGLNASTGLIDHAHLETGRAVAPLEAQWVVEIERAAHVHAEETSWRKAGQAMWLWVFVTIQMMLYQMGYCTQEIVANVLTAAFLSPLMTVDTAATGPIPTGCTAGRT